jgi:GTP-binding protein YchF
MNLSVGIVGLPNAGKSTLFNALLKKQVAFAANYPFATIEPNVGVVPVPDDRLDKLAAITKEEEKLEKLPPLRPATVEFVDIAGLVKGASEGEGLGNKFLAHIREVNIICNVLRFFPDSNIVHTEGGVDAERDRAIVETELVLADLQTLAKQQEPKMNATKEDRARYELVQTLKVAMDGGKRALEVLTSPEDQELIRPLQLLTMKPIVYVGNVSEAQLGNPPQTNLSPIVYICAQTESELAIMTPDEQKDYLASLGVVSSGLDLLIRTAYETLGLVSFLTTGELESRAWTIERGMKAPAAAGVIHTDFEKKFIKADVVAFADFVSLGGWKKAREAGKARSEGKEYVMQDGDVVEFKIGS